MIFQTDKGERIQADEQPRWSDFHKRFYVWGYRFIKSRQAFSKNKTLHNAKEMKATGA